VGQDRRTEQRVVGFSGGLERPHEGGIGLVGLAQVKELDATSQ
jgi:hypothetical protein